MQYFEQGQMPEQQLLISLHNVEFAKEFNYFITVQLESEGEKRRTDISACVSNPVFTASVFVVPFHGFKFGEIDRLHFAAFVVTDREQGGQGLAKELENQGQARLLGECSLDISQFKEILEDQHSTGIRKQQKFTRIQGDQEVGVGRFIVNLKIINEQIIPIEEQDYKPLDKEEIFHELPKPDQFYDFDWRLRVDIRSGIDLPMNRINPSGLPSTYVNIGHTMYDNQVPDSFHLQSTSLIQDNRHPLWNQQFMIPGPETVAEPEGFIYIAIYDKYLDTQPIDVIYIPVKAFTSFVPVNFQFNSQQGEYEARPKYFISVCLEQQNRVSLIDNLCDVVIHNANFDPLPYSSRMFLGITLNNHQSEIVPFVECELGQGANIGKVIEDYSSEQKATFISTIHKIPPFMNDAQYKSIAIFTLPKSFLDKSVQFFIAAKDDSIPTSHIMPNGVVGYTDIADDVLKKLFFQRDKKSAHIPVTWKNTSKMYPVFNTTKCLLEINCFNQDQVKEDQQKLLKQSQRSDSLNSDGRPKSSADKLADYMGIKLQKGAKETEKVNVLVRELSQKQEIIHRMIKEIDDKGESLKITASEIVDLRRQIKLLQSENAILRKRLAAEEQLEVQGLVKKEIAMMTSEELRTKILKLAQAYRDERVRNEEFDKALKNAQREIAQARQVQHELDITQRRHAENAKKLIVYQSEVQKTQVYKETIRKQEKVIQKLEKLMETTLKDTQKARGAQLEIESLRTENYQLQSKIQRGFGGDAEEVERMKMEIIRLEKIISELREQLKSKRPQSQDGSSLLQTEKMELEIKLQKAMSRNEALSDELVQISKNYSREIAQLKLVVAEKQAMLDTLTIGV